MALRAGRSGRGPGGVSPVRARGAGRLALVAGLAVAASSCLSPAAPAELPAPRASLAGAGDGSGLPRVVARPTEALVRYAELCARCHGPEGAGDGFLARTLDPPPTDLRAPERRLAPARAHRAIARGVIGSGMKRFDHVLDETALWDMAFHVWSLPDGPAELARGAELFAAGCASCHGVPGAPGAHRLDDPARARLAPAEVAARLRARHGADVPRDEPDVDALVAYLYAFLYEPIDASASGSTRPAPAPATSTPETH